ncbi:MAG: hypothetical protein WCL34_05595, partial [Methylococcaceae bacterium]
MTTPTTANSNLTQAKRAKNMMKYNNIREEELKNKIAQDYFEFFDCTKIIGNVDFCVTIRED